MEQSNGIYFDKGQLRNDDIYPVNEIAKLSELTSLGTKQGLDHAIISSGKIVNVVSDRYGHLPNENFFKQVEKQLSERGIGYVTRSINKDDSAFSVEYILDDKNIHVNVKNNLDEIRPMIKFWNAYDGSILTGGSFGFFRTVCSNGLNIATQEIGFRVKKNKPNVLEVVLPEITNLIGKFINNEYYSLHKKFEVLAEQPIKDLTNFIKDMSALTGLITYGASEKNPNTPSKAAKIVMQTIDTEAKLLNTEPNMWIGYNAFNAFLHNNLDKSFTEAKKVDERIFKATERLAVLQAMN